MKKKIILLITFILCIVLLTGCQCEHEWVEANCTTPKSCAKCGETEGEALSHNWLNATCQIPETCSRCEETRGITADHVWVDANCTAPKTCSVCNSTEGNALGHKEKDWEVTYTDMVDATETLKKYCSICEERLDREVRNLDSLHDTQRFLMTPKEFVTRLDNKLDVIGNIDLMAISGTSGSMFACGIFNSSRDNQVGLFWFYGNDISVNDSEKNEICFDGIIGKVTGEDNVAPTIVALIETCDPLLSFEDAKEIASNLFLTGKVTRNGITYEFTEKKGAVFTIGLGS